MNFQTIERDSTSWTTWRNRAFPFFERKIFLAHASVVPIPGAVQQALTDYVATIAREGQFEYVHRGAYNQCRERTARLLGHGAVPDEVAFAGSTSHALGIVATSLDWKPGDNCIVADGDFPANVVTWKNLEHTHGIEVRLIPHRPVMDIGIEDIAPLIDERTRLVSLASANFLSGYPLDVNRIGAYLHERNVLFCVDGIQTLGAVPLDVTHVDFVCADAHKWLLGPCGAAILWTRQSTLERMRPAILGWLATQNRDNWFSYDTTPITGAERFQPGERNYLGIVGLNAALQMLEEIGVETIAQRVTQLRDYTAQRLHEIGCKVLWMPQSTLPSGIVSFQPPRGDCPSLYQKLDERFALSLRQDKNDAHWIRVSAHFMNTQEDIDQLIAAIQNYLPNA
jgi:cysteine desulfurase/selenocysteine lyase